ncbi:YicC family protein [Planctomicrobium sp.]|nr:YicC family protein [Planctomicrobium sp.]
MTGHGDASGENDRLTVSAEVRSVNNRHLKVNVRCPDAYLSLESNVEKLVRKKVARGTLSVSLRVRQLNEQRAAKIDQAAVRQYWTQLTDIADELGINPPSEVTPLLSLPGIIQEDFERKVNESDWPLFEKIILEALRNFEEFRAEEGRSMLDELESLAGTVESSLEKVTQHAPAVVTDYRDRLINRVNDLLSDSAVKLESNDLIRETSVFADRCDITEEITRLRSHLQQYHTLLSSDEAAGRKLDFLGQEMFREVNTIGSKANNVNIAHLVVEMKAAIEKMREIIQNIE